MSLEQLKPPKAGEEIAIIKTSLGHIKIRLFPQIAPKAVENFKVHAQNKYYDGLLFHRVIHDFMIQGGDPEGSGRGGESIWRQAFEDEFHLYYRNFRGALSMANSGPNTNGSQFFIVQKQTRDKKIIEQMRNMGKDRGYPEEVVDIYEKYGGSYWLDFKHTVFGQVFQGMEVVDQIARLKTDDRDRPLEPVLMEKIRIIKYK